MEEQENLQATEVTEVEQPAENQEEQPVDTQEKPKKKKGLRLFGEIAFWAVIGIIGLFFIWNGIDQVSGYRMPFFGLRTSVIVSPSMEIANPENTYLNDSMKRIKKYDVITTVTYKSYDDVKLYDVVTYTSSNGLICHRVVDKYESDGQQFLVTRGDSNNVNDTPINYSLVRGKVILVTPAVGRVLLFVQSPYFLIGFFGSAFFIILGYYIFKNGKSKKKKDKEVVAETAGEALIEEPIEEEQLGEEIAPEEQPPAEEPSEPEKEENNKENIEKTPSEEVDDVPQEEANEKTSK